MNTLFDYAASLEAKADGMQRAADHADADWKAQALDAVWRVARGNETFIVDALWEVLDKPAEGRALGPVMLTAARKGWIRKTDRVRNTSQVKSHAAPVSVWQSLIYQPRIENVRTDLL